MRKLLVSVALSALALVTLPAASLGATAITSFKAKAVPIPKPGGGVFAHTGNCLGCGAAVEAEYTLSGSGYGVTAQNPNGGIPPISQVNFYLPSGARLRVYTLAGEKVRDLSADTVGHATWDGTNQSGQKVASGVYIIYVQGGTASKTLKVAIQR